MQRRCRLKRGMALILATIVIGSGTSIMTMPVSAENETVNTVEKKEQVDFHFPESKVTVVEKDPDFTIAAVGAVEGSIVTYSSDYPEVATVDNTGKVHLNREGRAVITATASETNEYKSKEISYELHVLGYCPPDVMEVVGGDKGNQSVDIDDIGSFLFEEWKLTKDELDLAVQTVKEVPKSLSIKYDTVDKIIEDMQKAMHSIIASEFIEEPVVYDVKLMAPNSDGNKTEVTAENFPEEGLTITVPYPEGIDRYKYDFVVSHMFTHEMNGKKPGDIECPKVTKGEYGITFTVMGLSPISIGWTEAKSEEEQPNDEKKVPQVVGDTFVWENGEVKIPVDLGGYTTEDVGVSVSINNGSRMLASIIEDNNIVISVFDFWREELERGHSFSKKGDYAAEVSFRARPDHNEINTNIITIKVPTDETSQIWNAEQKTAKFDGTQDITFTFANGTDFYALQSISNIQFFAWKYLEIDGERCSNFSVGENCYTYDMNAGTLTLSKEAIEYGIRESAKLWVKAGEDIKEYPKNIIINATAESKSGKSVYYLSSISVKDPETGFIGTDGAWKIDITDYDLKLEDLEDKKTDFSVGSDQVTVSKENGSVIENNALAKIKNDYAEQLDRLGDNYTVSSKLNLIPQEETVVPQEVKDGLQAQLGNKENVGQYYDINISADVLQNGLKVPGLENISINKLDQKITINLQIPETLRKSGRTYKVLHYNSETKNAEVLKSEVKDWIISFETDSFSPYALAYSDRTTSSGTNKPVFSDKDDNNNSDGNQGNQGNQNQPNNNNQSNNSGNQLKDQNSNNTNTTRVTAPKTADNNLMMLYLVMMICSIGAFVGVRKFKYCK